MENVKFTKGPWYRQAISDRIGILTGTGMAKRVIAVLKDSALPQEQIIGNSYLIAAAPELYEACKDLLGIIKTMHPGRWEHTVNRAIQAIQKAEGRNGR